MCSLEKRGSVYLLTLTGAGEHRLNPSLCDSVLSALASVRSDPTAGALVLAAEGKYFSNGFDLAWARQSPLDRIPLMSSRLLLVMASLVSFPMPTIAAITGHAAAAGLFLALTFDYRVMRSDRGFLYMSELDIGLPIPATYMKVVRSKVRDPRSVTRVLLAAGKVTADEGVRLGIVDRAVGSAPEAVEVALGIAKELGGRGWDGKLYAKLRIAAFPELAAGVGLREDEEADGRELIRAKI